ncbi:uncharacterized protein LOC120077225 [Benincasa hispida]|uniref:uncharacterized protein LOC120077225 n=1 Tax=Benincasa hispida TaxID=102211 RepID=UPI001900FEFB|nr:uncharacterized protein LOC120077225 [Benincasa hispida]
MSNSIISFLAHEKLAAKNYTTWKILINTKLVVNDLKFVLYEECPQTPGPNTEQNVRKAYDKWRKVNQQARIHILASIPDVLTEMLEPVQTAHEMIESLHELFELIYDTRLKEGTSVQEHIFDMMVHVKFAKMNGVVIEQSLTEKRKAKIVKG